MPSLRTLERPRRITAIKGPHSALPASKLDLPQPALFHKFIAISDKDQEEERRRLSAKTGVVGTLPELIVYKALEDLRVTFDFQSSLMGGRPGYQFDRQRADFVLWWPQVIIEVQGGYWHSKAEQEQRDAMRKLILEAEGWTVYYLDEYVVYDPILLRDWLIRHTSYQISRGATRTAPLE